MVRCAARNPATGRLTLVLGLEEGNVERLRAGKPIHIHADDLGFVGEIVILLGKDSNALSEMLSPLIGPNTDVRDERNRKPQ